MMWRAHGSRSEFHPHERFAALGGPGDTQSIVNRLGNKSDSKSSTNETLSSGVSVISKPSRLHVPPW
jgi:hypothetical protein